MHQIRYRTLLSTGLLAVMAVALPAAAALVDVTVTVQNLAPADSVSFAPLAPGFPQWQL